MLDARPPVRTPSSWRPRWPTSGPPTVAAAKIKKVGRPSRRPLVRLVRNPDVLAELVAERAPGQVVVGFAAETGDDDGDVLAHARAKLARKGCDLLVVNDVSGGAGVRPDPTTR